MLSKWIGMILISSDVDKQNELLTLQSLPAPESMNLSRSAGPSKQAKE